MTPAFPTFNLRDENELSLNLIEAQYELLKSKNSANAKSLLVLICGIELAGKGEAVKQFREWIDPRYLRVKALLPQLIQPQQPIWLRYTPEFPATGQICLMFGAWYSDLLATAMHSSKPFDYTVFKSYIDAIHSYEQDLIHNNIEVVKIWFDLSWKSLQKRLDHMDAHEQQLHQLYGLDWRNKKQYDTLQKVRKQITHHWFIIDGENKQKRDQMFAQYILYRIQQSKQHIPIETLPWRQHPIPDNLLHPATQHKSKEEYKAEIAELSKTVARLLRQEKRKIVLAFEGMDASGKGGAIKRIIKKLDPREYDIHTIAAPEQYELRRPYLWRFWTRLQKGRNIQIFDRTWYGRVLVERLEGYAKPHEWQRAYGEINRFETDLSHHQTIVIKFWLAISKDEQERRFKARESTPHKRFKITDEDWRNRAKWDKYLDATADMLAHTSTHLAPWHVIATDDKYTARIEVLKTIIKRLHGN